MTTKRNPLNLLVYVLYAVYIYKPLFGSIILFSSLLSGWELKRMESGDDVRKPLIGGMKQEDEEKQASQVAKSVSCIRGEFFQKLPEKVRCRIDPENLETIDLSAVKGLLQGTATTSLIFFSDLSLCYVKQILITSL